MTHNPEALKAIAVLGIDTQTLSQYGNFVFNISSLPQDRKDQMEKDVKNAILSAVNQIDILKAAIETR